MQQLVDIGVGPAGDVWVTNNWENDAAAFGKETEALSTQGAGQGVVVFYGMAKPVRTPLIGRRGAVTPESQGLTGAFCPFHWSAAIWAS
jgi:hypothetical protein